MSERTIVPTSDNMKQQSFAIVLWMNLIRGRIGGGHCICSGVEAFPTSACG